MRTRELTDFLELGVGNKSGLHSLEELADIADGEDAEAALFAIAVLSNPRWAGESTEVLMASEDRLIRLLDEKISSKDRCDAIRQYATLTFYYNILDSFDGNDLIADMGFIYSEYFHTIEDHLNGIERKTWLSDLSNRNLRGLASEFGVLALTNSLGILAICANPWEEVLLSRNKHKLTLQSGMDMVINPLTHKSVGVQVKSTANHPLKGYSEREWHALPEETRKILYREKYGEIPVIFTEYDDVKAAFDELREGSFGDGTLQFSKTINAIIHDTPPNPNLGPRY